MQWNLIRALLPYTERTEKIAVQLAKEFKGEKEDNLKYVYYYYQQYVVFEKFDAITVYKVQNFNSFLLQERHDILYHYKS